MPIREYMRLGVGGLLLETDAFRQQREATDRVKRGFLLVLLVGLLVGFASMIGQIGETLASRNRETVNQTIYDGLTRMPWYVNLHTSTPGFAETFQQNFDTITQVLDMVEGTSITGGVISFVATPLLFLATWLVYGLVAHPIARLLGGSGTLGHTLGCTALAAGANLLAVVQVVPFVQTGGIILLVLLANYVAIREAHTLSPWRALWATLFGPILLLLIGLVLVAGIGVMVLQGGSQ